MPRGVTLRMLLIGLSIVTGLFVLLLTIGGASDALRDVAPALERTQREVILESMHSTQFVRGLIGIILGALLAGWLGGSAARLFRSARSLDAVARDAQPAYWLQEAQDAATVNARIAGETAARLVTLERQRAELNRLLESVSEGILHLDGQGRVVRANRASRRLLSLPEDVEGMPIGSAVRSAELRTLLQRASLEPALPPREIAFDETTLVVTARRLGPAADARETRDAGGLAVAIADLTAIRRLEAVRRDFVANASHELKTPLTSIRGYAETLRDESLPPAMRSQFIATISSNAERLQHIVDDLLDLSRLESGTWTPVVTVLDPHVVAVEAWADFAPAAVARQIEFTVVADTEARLDADPAAMRQILSNLYSNAVRYTPARGRIEVRIRDWTVPRDLTVRDRRLRFLALEVRDTGSGIPLDALPHIFERFYRVDPARSRAEGGTGLGLSIVKHLAESMGGTIEAESQLGAGTTVRIILPAAGGARPGRDA